MVFNKTDKESNNEFDDLEFDSILSNKTDLKTLESIDYKKEFEPQNDKPTLLEDFEEVYQKYESKFGETFDPYLIRRGIDEDIEKTIKKMKSALSSNQPLKSSDLGLPDYNRPKDEFDIQPDY